MIMPFALEFPVCCRSKNRILAILLLLHRETHHVGTINKNYNMDERI
jgi:hypothetical protein